MTKVKVAKPDKDQIIREHIDRLQRIITVLDSTNSPAMKVNKVYQIAAAGLEPKDLP